MRASFLAVLVGLLPLPSLQADQVPSFLLEDINPASFRYQQMVSPTDYRLQVSAYYFGSAG